MRVEPVVGRPAAHDLEAVPLVEANVGHCHLGGLERQAAKAARSRHLVDPLQQPAPDAGALSRRIDSDLLDVEVFLLRFRPDGTDDALTIQSDVDVGVLEFRCKSLPLFGKPSRSVGRPLAPQSADIGREGCAYDAPDLFALRKQRRSEGQHHGRIIPNKTPASAAGGRVVQSVGKGYALSNPRSRRPRQMLTQWCLLISIRQTLMSARSGLEQAFSVAMAPENSIDGLKYVQSNT